MIIAFVILMMVFWLAINLAIKSYITISKVAIFAIDFVMVGGLGAMLGYKYIAPHFAEGKQLIVWAIIFVLLFCIVYFLLLGLISSIPIVGYIVNWGIGALGVYYAANFIIEPLEGIATFVMKSETPIHFSLFSSPTVNYIGFIILSIALGAWIARYRLEILDMDA